jgi:hypothetical protein
MIVFHMIEEAAEYDITPGMPVKGIPFLLHAKSEMICCGSERKLGF